MNAMARNALSAYSQVGVEVSVAVASPYKLILLLFDGAIKAIAQAKFHMEKKEISAKGAAITKAIAIIDEGLKLSLDIEAGGELAENLKSLYEYMCHRLLLANLNNETELLDEVSKLLVELRGAWAAIEKSPEVTGAVTQSSQPEKLEKATAATSFGRV